MLKALMIVGTGGFLGSALRYLFYCYIDKYFNTVFPLATFAVNIIGSLIIGLVIGLSLRENSMAAEWRMFLAVGFCGGFTTFSSFSMDGISLIQQGRLLTLLIYMAGSVILGFSAAGIGIMITKHTLP